MIDSYFTGTAQKVFIDPVAVMLYRLGIHPNTLTLFAAVLGLSLVPLISLGVTWAALSVLCLAGLLDTLDGSLARLCGTPTPFGAALDICCDRVVEACIVIGLFFAHAQTPILSLLLLASILWCITTFLVVGIFSDNQGEKSFHYSPGLVERTEAFIFFGLMIALPTFYVPLIVVLSVLIGVTGIIRLTQFGMANSSQDVVSD